MASEVTQAIQAICEEKGLSYEAVLKTVEAALAAAYRKDYGEKNQNIEVLFNPETGAIQAFDVKTVVEDMDLEVLAAEAEAREAERKKLLAEGKEVPVDTEEHKRFNPKIDIMLSEAKQKKEDAVIGEVLREELPVPTGFGRMAAQTAKQVIMQKLREAERETIYKEFAGRIGEVVMGIVQRREGRVVLIDFGATTAVLPFEEQIEREPYRPGQRLKVYIVSVELTGKGPYILVSRTHENLVRKIFEVEIPEVASGVVEIKAIAREAGARSKVAVWTEDSGVDPIGSCIGQRGTRIQTIISELGGEKIDVILYDEDPEEFITHALSPAKIIRVSLNPEGRTARAYVQADQFSLAIGKGGQNVRLAAHLTGWKINVVEESTGEESDGTLPDDSEELIPDDQGTTQETVASDTPQAAQE